jgi:hypothetical protein
MLIFRIIDEKMRKECGKLTDEQRLQSPRVAPSVRGRVEGKIPVGDEDRPFHLSIPFEN